MVKISDEKEFRAWLEDKPREVAVTLAARSALRILPIWPRVLGKAEKYARTTILLPILRATIASRLFGIILYTNAELIAAAYAAAVAAADAADVAADADATADATVYVAAIAYATYAGTYTYTVIDATAAADAAVAGAAAAAAAAADAYATYAAATMWSALSADCAALDAVGLAAMADQARALARKALWPGGAPTWATNVWGRLKRSLNGAGDEHWVVWADWYQGCLDGRSVDSSLDEKLILTPYRENLWDRAKNEGPGMVNRRLQAIIDEHNREKELPTLEAVADAMSLDKSTEREKEPPTLEAVADATLLDKSAEGEKEPPTLEAVAEAMPLDKSVEREEELPTLEAMAEAMPLDKSTEGEKEPPTPEAVVEAMPLDKSVEVDGATGNVNSGPPKERAPRAPSRISNTAFIGDELSQLTRHIEELIGKEYNIAPVLVRIQAALDAGVNAPNKVHTECQNALRRMEREIEAGNLPQYKKAPELEDLHGDLSNTIKVLWEIYPEIEAMAVRKEDLALRPLTPEEQAIFENAMDAFVEVVDEKLRAEFRDDLEAIKQAKEAAEAQPNLDLPQGPLRDRVYDLTATLARIMQYTRMAPQQLERLFDAGVNAANKIAQYEKARKALEPIWQGLQEFLKNLMSKL